MDSLALKQFASFTTLRVEKIANVTLARLCTPVGTCIVKPGGPGVRCLSLHSRPAAQGMVADLAVL